MTRATFAFMTMPPSVLDFLFQFDEPTSRLYHVNILSSLLLIFAFAWFSSRSPAIMKTLKKWLFQKKYWWNASTKQDYFIFLFNGFLKAVLLVPLLECSFWISHKTVLGLIALQGTRETLDLETTTWALGLFSLGSFIWDDFLRFFHHWLMHQNNFLWSFHKTHHSARILTPISLYRTHPVEAAMAVLRNSLSLGVASGVFVFLFGATMSVWTILGVNAFGFLFNLIGANLRHSHIPLSFGFLEYLVISPLQHQVHHSTKPEHYDKNFGVTLAFWDFLLGTWVPSKNIKALKFGIREPFKKSFLKLLIEPFQSAFKTKTDT